VDTGPLLSQRALPIEPGETAGLLTDKLAQLGADLLVETIPAYLSGQLSPQPQDESQATYAPLLKKEDAELDFSLSAELLARQVQAFNPWPGAFTTWQGLVLKVHRAHAVDAPSTGAGIRAVHAGLPAIGTGRGLLVLDEVQPAGKRPIPGQAFLLGARNWARAA
jgi:methionyl-tRNA formyltransferase